MVPASVAATIYFIVSTVLLVSYALVLVAIFIDKQVFNVPCYKLMFFMGIADMATTVIFGPLAAIQSLLDTNFGQPFARLYGAFQTFTLEYGAFAMTLLAIVRLIGTTHWKMYIKGKRIYYWIGLCFAFAFANFLICVIPPDVIVIYDPKQHVMSYEVPAPQWLFMFYTVLYSLFVSINILAHAAFYWKLHKMCLGMTAEAKQKMDFKSCFKAPAINSALFVITAVYFWTCQKLNFSADFAPMLSNLCSMICFGLNGAVCIIFIPTIRLQVRNILFRHGKAAVAPAVAVGDSLNPQLTSQAQLKLSGVSSSKSSTHHPVAVEETAA